MKDIRFLLYRVLRTISQPWVMIYSLIISLLCLINTVWAFDNGRFDNASHFLDYMSTVLTSPLGCRVSRDHDTVAVNLNTLPLRYWGQNSYGAGHSDDPSNFQKRLSYYCNDNAIDVFPLAFANVFFGTGGLPSLNLANTCNPMDNATFSGTALPNCQSLASDIATCQSKGKIVTLSLGGATGAVGFQSDSQANSFAQTIWDLFLGGSSSTRPFGNAVLDGVDLDIEGGGSTYYATFVNKIRSLGAQSSKKFYITAAPQCVYPDAALSGVLNSASFDAIYVQFYNNPCGLQNYGQASNWNFGIWDNWARTISPNKNVKVYIGAPASSSAAGGGYVALNTLSSIAVEMRKSFPSFGGVMMWDASQAYANNRYDLAIKNALVAAGGTGFSYPACSAPAFVAGSNYAGGSLVSYGGYIWQAKWFASSQPKHDPSGEWSAVSVCSAGGSTVTTSRPATSITSTTTRSPSTTTTTTKQTTTTTASQPPATTTSTNGRCTGVPSWSSSVAYQGGAQVIYNSHIWTASWWTQADTPGDAAGVWTDGGPCN
ncbi:glycoside hydrolase superfamily [Panaeolus papilionaceus]|nr:glycoside hydrolase superfamily [Panaeolus papilionaceus]